MSHGVSINVDRNTRSRGRKPVIIASQAPDPRQAVTAVAVDGVHLLTTGMWRRR